MIDYKEVIRQLKEFRDARDWEQFHDSKNLATAISIEAAELNELYLWKTIKESEEVNLNIQSNSGNYNFYIFDLAE